MLLIWNLGLSERSQVFDLVHVAHLLHECNNQSMCWVTLHVSAVFE